MGDKVLLEPKFGKGNKYDYKANKIYYYIRQYKLQRDKCFILSPLNKFCIVNIKGLKYVITLDTENDYYDFIVILMLRAEIKYVSLQFNNIYDFLNALDYYIKYGKEWTKETNHTIFNEKGEFKNCIIKIKTGGGLDRYSYAKIL